MSGSGSSVIGYVLAGGQSRRMGQDKAFLQVNGRPLIEHAVRQLQQVCTEVRILSGPARSDRDACLVRYGPLVPDEETGYAGPLAGVAAALADCTRVGAGSGCALIAAVDQPDLLATLLSRLVTLVATGGAAAACLQHGDRIEPLPLAASPALLPALRQGLAAGERRLLPAVRSAAALLPGPGLALWPLADGPATGLHMHNLNTPDDLERWLGTGHASNQSARPASE